MKAIICGIIFEQLRRKNRQLFNSLVKFNSTRNLNDLPSNSHTIVNDIIYRQGKKYLSKKMVFRPEVKVYLDLLTEYSTVVENIEKMTVPRSILPFVKVEYDFYKNKVRDFYLSELTDEVLQQMKITLIVNLNEEVKFVKV